MMLGLGSMAGGAGSMAGGAKFEEGDLGARSLRSLRRSARLLQIKQERAKERSEILRLKRDLKALMKRTAAAEPLPSAGKNRKKVIRTTPLKKELIDFMIAKPYKPLDGFPEEKLATYSQEIREIYAKQKAVADKVLEYEQALIRQFEKRGYAEDYTEVEVTDNEDNQ